MDKSKKNVCAFSECKKKIGIVDMLSSGCKCGKFYCLTHRLPERHNCHYDYSTEVNKKKEIDNMKCVAVYDKI